MITTKIKAFLSLKNTGLTKYAEFLGKSQPSLSNKAKRDTWTASDLINLAEMTNSKLAIIDNNEKVVITFEKEDIKK